MKAFVLVISEISSVFASSGREGSKEPEISETVFDLSSSLTDNISVPSSCGTWPTWPLSSVLNSSSSSWGILFFSSVFRFETSVDYIIFLMHYAVYNEGFKKLQLIFNFLSMNHYFVHITKYQYPPI